MTDKEIELFNKCSKLEAENEKLQKQNKGFIRLLEGIESALKRIKKNADKEVVLYWIKENVIKVFKEERLEGFPFEWID